MEVTPQLCECCHILSYYCFFNTVTVFTISHPVRNLLASSFPFEQKPRCEITDLTTVHIIVFISHGYKPYHLLGSTWDGATLLGLERLEHSQILKVPWSGRNLGSRGPKSRSGSVYLATYGLSLKIH